MSVKVKAFVDNARQEVGRSIWKKGAKQGY